MLLFFLYLLTIPIVYFIIVVMDVHFFGRVFKPIEDDIQGPLLVLFISCLWLPIAISAVVGGLFMWFLH
jgi:hypothetical protein